MRVLAFEHPELRATQVDLDPAGSIADLVAEVRADQPDDEVAWRGGRRYSARLARVPLAGGEVPVGEGAYLISGGLGELGLLVAGWLARHGATRLVLSGRTEPATGVLDGLRAQGVEVDVVLGDVAEPGVADRLVQHAQRGGVRLRGVVHGAGVLADRTVAEMGADELARAWWPKVVGGWRLHEATSGVPLDWWLAQSSLAGLVGSPGQAAYATANAWLDALVTARRAAGLPATTINWSAWTRTDGPEDRVNAALASVEPAAALDALGAVLADGRSSAGVAQGDLSRAAELFPALAARPFLADLVARPVSAEHRGELTTLAAVQDRLLARVAELLGTPPEQVDVHVPLTTLGLDSLMAMRLRTAVQRDFGAQPSAALLLRGASTAAAAAALAADLGIEDASLEPAVIGPRDPAERWVALVWQDVLGVGEIGVRQEFAELGGTSEHADRVRAAVAERLGEVPADLFATPTIEAMADMVRAAFESSPEGTVRILREGDGRPLHLFHPAGGPTSVYQPLVAQLSPGRPCLGYERVDHLGTVEEKAEHYADLVLEHQPAGPYALGGWSFGGCLAYEVAQVLAARGEQVELVFLIDTILPLSTTDDSEETMLPRFGRFAEHIERTYGAALDLSLDELADADEKEQIRIVLDRVRATVPGIGAAVLHHQYTSYVDARVAERYRPRMWEGPVLLLRAENPYPLTGSLDPRYLRTDDALGWDELCPDMRVTRVPGDHVSMIDPPHVEVLAARLDAALRTIPPQDRRNER